MWTDGNQGQDESGEDRLSETAQSKVLLMGSKHYLSYAHLQRRAYRLSTKMLFGILTCTPTLPSTSCVMATSAAMLAS